MSASTIGLLAGIALGFAVAFGGFTAFVIVLMFGALGLAIGRALDGQLDISALFGDRSDRPR